MTSVREILTGNELDLFGAVLLKLPRNHDETDVAYRDRMRGNSDPDDVAVILTVDIEISDQMGKDHTHVVGTFDNAEDLVSARGLIERAVRTRRTWFKMIPTRKNQVIAPPRDLR
jgi:hypothetical protein